MQDFKSFGPLGAELQAPHLSEKQDFAPTLLKFYQNTKGDCKVRFSGQQRRLLRNLNTNMYEILHCRKLFWVILENVEFEISDQDRKR